MAGRGATLLQTIQLITPPESDTRQHYDTTTAKSNEEENQIAP